MDHSRSLRGAGEQGWAGSPDCVPHKARWAPDGCPGPQAAELGPGCASPAGPSQLRVAALDSRFRLFHGWWPPSRSRTLSLPALQPRAWGPTGEIRLLKAAGSAKAPTSRGQRNPQALCSVSEPQSWQTELCSSGPHLSHSRELPSLGGWDSAGLWRVYVWRVPLGTSHFGSYFIFLFFVHPLKKNYMYWCDIG